MNSKLPLKANKYLAAKIQSQQEKRKKDYEELKAWCQRPQFHSVETWNKQMTCSKVIIAVRSLFLGLLTPACQWYCRCAACNGQTSITCGGGHLVVPRAYVLMTATHITSMTRLLD